MLERLWAGWRSEYVSGFGPEGNNVPQDGESIFSRILASGLPDDETHIVARGSKCFVILNAYPYASGHCLVLPYRQVANLEDLTDDERNELWLTVRDATLALKTTGDEVIDTILGAMAAAAECELYGNIPVEPAMVMKKIETY